MKNLHLIVAITLLFMMACKPSTEIPATSPDADKTTIPVKAITLDLAEAERLLELPMECIQQEYPYKSGVTIAKEEDLALPRVHHPAFYGCFDWHSAVHGHWSIVYLLKTFPDINRAEEAIAMLDQNLTAEHIQQEIAYFSMNKSSKSFERTYGWAWLLKLQEELLSWDHPKAKEWYENIQPLAEHISQQYIEYLPKLVYPIRVGEHSNTAFGLSFAYDYAMAVNDTALAASIKENALRFYSADRDCPISWEPSGYDFLSPCLQEIDIMRKVLDKDAFVKWNKDFLPSLADGSLSLIPAIIKDRSDGKLVHLDGLNFSRAWCLFPLEGNNHATQLAAEHLSFSLGNVKDGDYAGQHWLGSFALYAFKSQGKYK